MQLVILYIATVVAFLGLDAVFLKTVMRPLFEEHIGDWLLEDFRLVPAAIFYLCYIAGVLYFVSLPNLANGSLGAVFLRGAILGAMAYGTYEFTNFAVLDRWHPSMVATDVAWGAVLTGTSALVGVWITRAVS